MDIDHSINYQGSAKHNTEIQDLVQRIKKILKRIIRLFAKKFGLSESGDVLIPDQAVNQLFYDVANFVVYNQIPGDYLEFGVYKGESLSKIYQYLSLQWQTYKEHAERFHHDYDLFYWENKRFIAFDSFEGLPSTDKNETPIHYSSGVYKCTKEEFYNNIKIKGVDLSKVIVIPGWFLETLTIETIRENKIIRAAIIFIDCDLYESAIPIFSFITNLIQDGTVIIIDDFFRYKGHPRKGLQGAFNEWRESSPHIQTNELTRCSANRVAFVCYLKN